MSRKIKTIVDRAADHLRKWGYVWSVDAVKPLPQAVADFALSERKAAVDEFLIAVRGCGNMTKDEARDAAVCQFKRRYPLVIREAEYARQVLDGFDEGFDAGWDAQPAERLRRRYVHGVNGRI